jgi:hypothetical protein
MKHLTLFLLTFILLHDYRSGSEIEVIKESVRSVQVVGFCPPVYNAFCTKVDAGGQSFYVRESLQDVMELIK